MTLLNNALMALFQVPFPLGRTRVDSQFTHGFSDTWKDFVTYPCNNRAVTSARERLSVRRSDPDVTKPTPRKPLQRWRVTQEFFTSFVPGKANGDEFVAMFFDETGGVIVWTRKSTWGVFAECGSSIEKLLCMQRAPKPFDALEVPYRTEWQDIALCNDIRVPITLRERLESLPPLDITEVNAFSGNIRITLNHIRRDADDPLIAQLIAPSGKVMIWTEQVLASIRTIQLGERIIKLPRNPMADISGCYNHFPSDAECLPTR